MRKTLAKILFVFIFLPMSLGALALLSVSGWVLDKGFYKGIAANEKLYEAMGDKGYRELADGISREASIKMDPDALAAGLEASLPPSALAKTAGDFIDGVFAGIQAPGGLSALDFRPLKAALTAERLDAFATAYVAAMPKGGSLPAGGVKAIEDFSALPAGVKPADAVAAVDLKLAELVKEIPDSSPIDRSARPSRFAVYSADLPISADGLARAGWGMTGASIAVLLALALLAERRWLDRAVFAGKSLILPGAIIFFVGAAGYLASGSNFAVELYKQIPLAVGASSVSSVVVGTIQEAIKTATGGFFWAGLITLSAGGFLASMRRLKPLTEKDDDDLDR